MLNLYFQTLFCCRHGVNPPVVAECEGDYTFDKRSGSLQWQVWSRNYHIFGGRFKILSISASCDRRVEQDGQHGVRVRRQRRRLLPRPRQLLLQEVLLRDSGRSFQFPCLDFFSSKMILEVYKVLNTLLTVIKSFN